MINRFLFETDNFVYVYHSGGLGVDHCIYMGMTHDAYKTSKGTYKVSCFCRMDSSRKELIDEIENEFSMEKSIRCIGAKTKEEAIACLNDFLNIVKPKILKSYPDDRTYSIIFPMGRYDKGILFGGYIEPILCKGYNERGLFFDPEIAVFLKGTVENETNLLTSKLAFSRKGYTPLDFVKLQYNVKQCNCIMLRIQENIDGFSAVYDVLAVKLSESAFDLVSKLVEFDADVVLRNYDSCSYLMS